MLLYVLRKSEGWISEILTCYESNIKIRVKIVLFSRLSAELEILNINRIYKYDFLT